MFDQDTGEALNLTRANKMVRKIRHLTQERRRICDEAAQNVREWSVWKANETRRIDKEIDALEAMLGGALLRMRANGYPDKTLRLPAGEIHLRQQPVQVHILDKDAFTQHLLDCQIDALLNRPPATVNTSALRGWIGEDKRFKPQCDGSVVDTDTGVVLPLTVFYPGDRPSVQVYEDNTTPTTAPTTEGEGTNEPVSTDNV